MSASSRAFLVLALSTACSSDGSFGGDGPSGSAVGQGGAQDFGRFREILDEGGIPGPSTLDDVGFFNEHRIELPAPTCGREVCVHGELGVMGNMLNGSNCTLVMLGLGTPVDPESIPRLPLNLAIAIDTSSSMIGEPIGYVREGLLRMLDELDAEDTISIVTFDDSAAVVVEAVAGDDPDLAQAIASIEAVGKTNIYDGLRRAYEVVAEHADATRQNRVILLSDGDATDGITSAAKLVHMSAAYNAQGYSVATIAMGADVDPALMRELAEQGGGAFYYLESPAAVAEVFEEEVRAFLVPLARDLVIDVDIAPEYDLRAIYGTKRAVMLGSAAHIEIPSVQIAHRTSADDDSGGRRGGGGAMLLELVPSSDDSTASGTVGEITTSYIPPQGVESVVQVTTIESPLAPGEAPPSGHFSFAGVEKAFVMLNIFAGFQMAATRAAYGDYTGALGVLEPLAVAVEEWLSSHDDPDIESDLSYIEKFIANLRSQGVEPPPSSLPVPNPWPRD
jgi:Ca-activated chloride channel family protein